MTLFRCKYSLNVNLWAMVNGLFTNSDPSARASQGRHEIGGRGVVNHAMRPFHCYFLVTVIFDSQGALASGLFGNARLNSITLRDIRKYR